MNNLTETDLAFIFVCQKGRIASMAALLAASLRRYAPRAKLIAAIPGPVPAWGYPETDVLNLLDRLKVELRHFENPANPNIVGDGCSNKIFCLEQAVSEKRIAFLDSDIICISAPDELYTLPSGHIYAKVVDKAYSGSWDKVYAQLGMAPSDVRLTTTVSLESTPPYFNSGFIQMDAGTGPAFAERWKSDFRAMPIEGSSSLERFYREQLTFAATIVKYGYPYRTLGEKYNFPLPFGSVPRDQYQRPVFVHYHDFWRVKHDRVLRDELSESIRFAPELASILERLPTVNVHTALREKAKIWIKYGRDRKKARRADISVY